MVAQLLGAGLAPVLKLLWPAFKWTAIAATYLGEYLYRGVALVLGAVGSFVAGLGRLINAITPFANPGNPLVRAGEALKNTANEFRDSARELAEGRQELKQMTFGDALDSATDSLRSFTEQLTNVPAVINAHLLRYRASAGAFAGGTAPQVSAAADMPRASAPVSITGPIHVHGVEDPQHFLEKLAQIVKDARERGGVSSFHAALGLAG
jgi:hypothetical protein